MRQDRTRRGLTLLELLLALSMIGAILGIVWGVMLVLAQMETRRIQYAGQQRIIRHWTQQLNDDIRTAIQDTEQLTQGPGGETIRHFGVAGTSTQLRIDRSDDSSDLRTVFYEFHPISGLIRQTRDYTAEQSAEGTAHMASEIVSGQFRYFDGNAWHDQWSSLERQSAPSAIELTFYSLSSIEADRWRRQVPNTDKPAVHQVVVHIPSVSHGSETYQRTQPPLPPREEQPPSLPSPSPSPAPPSLFRSLFGDDEHPTGH